MNSDEKTITRRQFLTAAGCTCAAALAIGGIARARGVAAVAAANVSCPYGYRYDAWPGQCYRYVDSTGSGYCDFSEPLITTVQAAEATAAPATSASDTAAAATATPAATEELVVLCDRGCGYPGQCARFLDSDGSGVCDLTEGIPASLAAALGYQSGTTAAAASSSSAESSASGSAGSSASSADSSASSSSASTELVILCDRGCSYPGNCGRYTDSNGTGRCDLSEGIPADQAATYGGFNQGGGRGRGRGG